MSTSETWTEENVASLRELIAAGASGGYAARELGLTRNQVIGKATRMGLHFGQVVKAVDTPAPTALEPVKAVSVAQAARRPATPKPSNIFTASAANVAPRPAPPEVAAQRAEDYLASPSRRHAFDADFAPPGARFLSLLELGQNMCKWPLFEEGPRVFCGCTTVGANDAGRLPYCEHHQQMSRAPL